MTDRPNRIEAVGMKLIVAGALTVVIAGLGVGWSLLADTGTAGRHPCEPAHQRIASLENDSALSLVAPRIKDAVRFAVDPCESDDRTGSVGVTGTDPTAAKSEFMEFLRRELPQIGWSLVIDDSGPVVSGSPGGLDRLCFESGREPGARLVVSRVGNLNVFVEIQFADGGRRCGDLSR